jgi:hypothetical protein
MTTQYIKNATAENYQYNQDIYYAYALAPKHAKASVGSPACPSPGPHVTVSRSECLSGTNNNQLGSMTVDVLIPPFSF